MKTPQFIQIYHANDVQIRAELATGLLDKNAHTSPKYLYDALGSKLFEAICELPEYYPTRTESAIFADHVQAICTHVPQGATLVDLGAGNCQKALRLFQWLQPSRYVAVDISVDFLTSAMTRLQYQHPDLEMVGVGMDFAEALALPPVAMRGDKPRVFFYPGSSIGNFTPPEALAFLQRIHAACASQDSKAQQREGGLEEGLQGGSRGGLLIGVDLVTGKAELEAAYDDALGVTAAFNRNMLLHINRLIGSDFNINDWAHVALYNESLSRIEMHLQAKQDVVLSWTETGANRTQRGFTKGERIHTESSYKWTVAGFSGLLQNAGFAKPVVWTDTDQRFAVMWAANP